MKNIYITYFCFTLFLFTITGCEDILNTKAKDAFTEDFLYSDPAQIEKALFTAYNSTESWGLSKYSFWTERTNLECASFEAKFNFKDEDLYHLRTGMTAANGGGYFTKRWKNYWDYVRLTNEFLAKIDNSEAMKKDPTKVNVLKAEMRFLRANLYRKLIAYYGGVPIMKKPLGKDDNFNLARNSYAECVKFIVDELDAAAKVLPEKRPDSEFGRATKLAALAVKSRTLLYAASKLHDPASAPKNNTLYTYDKSTKWQEASDAAKAVIDLVGARDLIAVKNADEYQKLFLYPNKDILFARPYGSQYYDFGSDVTSLPEQTQTPNGYNGWGLSTPTHNFAMIFHMKDGSKASDILNKNNPNAVNEGREMRYYADLLYNGATFRGRDIQYWLHLDDNGHPDLTKIQGLDSPKGEGNIAHSSKTGYNIRKFQDESIDVTGISPKRPYILFRLAEIYLNYAEAQCHLGNYAEARKFVNKVSTRALQPTITVSGTDLLNAIKHERRIELCFEGHNFFDERRWMEESHLGFNVEGLKWSKDVNGKLSFKKDDKLFTRPWFKRQYYLPIPISEIEKAPSIKQNDGY